MTPTELVLTFGGLHVCVQFGENRRKNATMRVSTDGQTRAETQNDFIICPMLYAIAMGQIITVKELKQKPINTDLLSNSCVICSDLIVAAIPWRAPVRVGVRLSVFQSVCCLSHIDF